MTETTDRCANTIALLRKHLDKNEYLLYLHNQSKAIVWTRGKIQKRQYVCGIMLGPSTGWISEIYSPIHHAARTIDIIQGIPCHDHAEEVVKAWVPKTALVSKHYLNQLEEKS